MLVRTTLFLEFQQPQRITSKVFKLACKSILLVSSQWLTTFVTLKLVPVSTKIHVSDCLCVSWRFSGICPGPVLQKSCLDTLNTVGGKIGKWDKKVKDHCPKMSKRLKLSAAAYCTQTRNFSEIFRVHRCICRGVVLKGEVWERTIKLAILK